MSTKKVVLDTNVFGWALREKANETETPLKIKAEKYLKKLNANKIQIVLPSVVLFELLSVYTDSEEDIRAKNEFLTEISKHCRISNFDDVAASIAATYFNYANNGKPDHDPVEREKSRKKADIMILAQATCANATELITGDKGFIKVAAHLHEANLCPVEAKEIPEDEQSEIFEVIET